MIRLRKSEARGFKDHGWLKTRHTFSFADYHDPDFMGFSVLRVLNEDRILGGTGFGTHGHENMEIISYVVEGELEHKDSMGTNTLIKPGEVQRMSAGTGIRHSEYNHLPNKTTHFLQIWILPAMKGGEPSYGQKSFESELTSGNLTLVVSKNGRDNSISLQQDIDMFVCKASQANQKTVVLSSPQRRLWIQVIKGVVEMNGISLKAGDGASGEDESNYKLSWTKDSEFLYFDLP